MVGFLDGRRFWEGTGLGVLKGGRKALRAASLESARKV